MISSPAIIAIVLAIFVALAFGGGFAVSDWRSASEIQRLNSSNAVLSAANDKCATDIQSVRSAMDAVAAASALRDKNAAVAMRRAESVAAKHTNRAKKIIALPPVALEHQCEVLTREQVEYVKNRRQNN
jgi:hypothetical protein